MEILKDIGGIKYYKKTYYRNVTLSMTLIFNNVGKK